MHGTLTPRDTDQRETDRCKLTRVDKPISLLCTLTSYHLSCLMIGLPWVGRTRNIIYPKEIDIETHDYNGHGNGLANRHVERPCVGISTKP